MTHRVILVRHGEAGPGRPDHLRSLTPRGIIDTESVASRLAIDPTAVVILSSPYLRARQTAEILAKGLSLNPQSVVEIEGVTPDDDPVGFTETLFNDVLPKHVDKTVVLVTHMPFVSALRGLLVDGNIRYGTPFSTSESHVLEATQPVIGGFMVARTVLPKT